MTAGDRPIDWGHLQPVLPYEGPHSPIDKLGPPVDLSWMADCADTEFVPLLPLYGEEGADVIGWLDYRGWDCGQWVLARWAS